MDKLYTTAFGISMVLFVVLAPVLAFKSRRARSFRTRKRYDYAIYALFSLPIVVPAFAAPLSESLFLLGIPVAASIAWHCRVSKPSGNTRLSLVEKQFLKAKIKHRDPRYRFNPATAIVLLTDPQVRYGETGVASEASFERLCKNIPGEYFYVNANEDSASVTHITLTRAMLIARRDPAVYEREFGTTR